MYEVLIVEDDPMVAMINKQYVNQNTHFHVAGVCKDGLSALEYLQKHTIHLVVLDVYMPRNDGLMLLRKIREKQLPVSVIMVTAANDSATIEEALRLGIVDYLVKPFLNERFQQALEIFLSRQDTFHDLASFDQQHIDVLIRGTHIKSTDQLPKGIQLQTLELIYAALEENHAVELTAEELADQIGLSRVTVRRYMNYLLETGEIIGKMNYETGGRPCMLYRSNRRKV